MKPAVRKFRRIEDGLIIEAMQYTLGPDAVTNLAKFVLNMNVDATISVANERILDVVRPIFSEWSPKEHKATVEVVDPKSGLTFLLKLDQWIGRHDGQFMFIEPDVFKSEYEEVYPEPQKTELDELSDVIYDSFFTLEGDLYQALARTAAAAVIRAGWSKKGAT